MSLNLIGYNIPSCLVRVDRQPNQTLVLGDVGQSVSLIPSPHRPSAARAMLVISRTQANAWFAARRTPKARVCYSEMQ